MRRNRLLSGVAAATVALGGAFVLPSPASAAMNVQRVESSSVYNGDDFKIVSVSCPLNTKVIGGGADLSGGGQNVHIAGMHPDSATNSYVALAKEHTPTDVSWKVISHAVCAPQPAGYHIVEALVDWSSSTTKADEAFCTSGKVLGVGGRIAAPDVGKVLLTYVKPTPTGNGAEAGAVEVTGGYSSDWKLTIWAICATEPSGWQPVADTVGPGAQWAFVTCPPTKKLTTAGAYISLSLGKIFLREVTVFTAGDDPAVPDSIGAAMDQIANIDHEWMIKAHGICVS